MKDYPSLWLREAGADREEPTPALGGDERADVCIVGGGYTGLWTALHLKDLEPSLDIAVIERDVCGSGASGRNGGFILSWWSKFTSLRKICGDAEARRLARLSADVAGEIAGFCQRNSIDIHYRPDGWLWTASGPAQVGSWDETLEAAAEGGDEPFEVWQSAEVGARSGSEKNIAGVFEANAATVQPAHLVRGLRRVALERGVRIFENTPLVRLAESRPPVVVTPNGSLRAKHVVLAMNAWAIRFAEIRKALIAVTSDIVATPPIPERLAKIGLRDGLCISDGRTLVHYSRTTLDGRMVFGKGGMTGNLPFGGNISSSFDGSPQLTERITRWMHWSYPELADVPIDCSWNGLIDRGLDGLPRVNTLGGRPAISYAVGFSGNGVGPCYLVGRMLASLALERKDEWSQCPLVRAPQRDFPPEPIRYLGGQLVRRAVAACDDAADAGRRPNPVARLLAGFAPAGLTPFKKPGSTAPPR